MNHCNYYLPTRIIFGVGCFEKIGDCLKNFPGKRVLLVTGMNAMKKKGYIDKAIKLLGDYAVEIFDRVEPNPSTEIIKDGIEFATEKRSEIIIGMGGGSALDVGKVIAIIVKNGGKLENHLKKPEKINTPPLPYVTVPTTAGSGGEVTKFATVWDKKNLKKNSLAHNFMFPKIALVDPTMTLGLPPDVTAASGLDALCHSVEACWAKTSNMISDTFALESIRLITANLHGAFSEPDNLHFRENMMKASLYAGLAFSNTRTTAAHSVSYPLTLRFGIPHGLACATTLIEFMKFNYHAAKEKINLILNAIGANNLESGCKKLEKLMNDLKIPTSLSQMGLNRDDIDILVNEGFTQGRVENNPREVTEAGLRKILEAIF